MQFNFENKGAIWWIKNENYNFYRIYFAVYNFIFTFAKRTKSVYRIWSC